MTGRPFPVEFPAMSNSQISVEMRLVTYGTLAPGRVNHHQLSGMGGRWLEGTVSGRLFDCGWGALHDCPGMILDLSAGAVPVFLFESPDLPVHWPRLDDFELAFGKNIRYASGGRTFA